MAASGVVGVVGVAVAAGKAICAVERATSRDLCEGFKSTSSTVGGFSGLEVRSKLAGGDTSVQTLDGT